MNDLITALNRIRDEVFECSFVEVVALSMDHPAVMLTIGWPDGFTWNNIVERNTRETDKQIVDRVIYVANSRRAQAQGAPCRD